MQPVTIKNNQFINTLWMSQTILCLLMLLIIGLAVQVDYRILAVLPLLLVAIWTNHKAIKLQKDFQFQFKTPGKMMLYSRSPFTEKWSDDIKLTGFWQIPQALVIKFTHTNNNQNIHLTVFRSVIGKAQFSDLLVGLGQASLKE